MTYFEVAEKSYAGLTKFFDYAKETSWYNSFAAECQQVVERMMKALVETFSDMSLPDSLFKTHNLRRLTQVINSKYPDLVDEQKVAWIEDFYFDARYPGDDFIVVSEDTALKLLDATKQTVTAIEKIYKSRTAQTTDIFSDMKVLNVAKTGLPQRFKDGLVAVINYVKNNPFPGLKSVVLLEVLHGVK